MTDNKWLRDEVRLVASHVYVSVLFCSIPVLIMATIDQIFGTTSLRNLAHMLNPHLRDIVIAAILTPVIFVLNSVISTYIHMKWPPRIVMNDDDEGPQILLGRFIESVSTGFEEEFCFRGVIQVYGGFWLASFLFGLNHYIVRRYWGDVARTMLVGFQLGLVMMLSGSLIACMVIHAANNFLSPSIFTDKLDDWCERYFS